MCIKGDNLRLKRVCQEDCRLLWEWANAPDVRAVSFSTEPILWEQHLKWFNSKVSDPNCLFYILIDNNEIPSGQVRCDINGKEAVISISIDSKCRGKGYGSEAITLVSNQLFRTSDVELIHAYIKLENTGSIKAFKKAGYKEAGTTIINGHEAYHFVYERPA
ncbi:MAG: GNAT family N-acetyltransferase [Calditerrivibrio sp.]|nr:GNAT family N-acetyltransferase [Calditerrivibrio sp.]